MASEDIGEPDGGEGGGGVGGSMPGKPEKAIAQFRLSSGAGLFISTVLLAISFLCHIFFLFLVEPLKYLVISKDEAMVYSGVPLAFGVIFLAAAIYSFMKIETRSPIHIIVLIFVFAFGSLTLQGLAGIAMHLVHVSSSRV
jgi:hypothetical protein